MFEEVRDNPLPTTDEFPWVLNTGRGSVGQWHTQSRTKEVKFVEDVSVMIQVAYFKYTKRRYGEGKRVFKMTPLHHHFQKQGNSGIQALIQKPLAAIPESKIVTRFWIVGLFLAIITFATLKLR